MSGTGQHPGTAGRMGARLRLLLAAALLVAAALPCRAREIVDLAGRHVTLPETVDKVILGEGRFLPALAILEPEDPVARLAGTMADFRDLDPATHAQYLGRFPSLADVPIIGRSTAESFSLEAAIALGPDVAILGLGGGHGPGVADTPLIGALQAAGIAVVFIDFRVDPLVNTPRSIALLGEILGRQARADAFNAFYQHQLDRIAERVERAGRRPTVFLESRVGLHDQCCETMGDAMLGRFIAWAGGDNIAADLVPGMVGTVSIELLLEVQPDHYVATAIGSSAAAPTPGRIVLGTGATADAARRTLARALDRTGIADLEAVRAGRVHAVWHHFYNSPFNVAAVQAMAAWFHPQLFADVDARATLAEFYARFQPVPLDGTFWTSLADPPGGDGG